jgi:murein DD-endopeptidase MepM/ murein hydrolase activator NlpD
LTPRQPCGTIAGALQVPVGCGGNFCFLREEKVALMEKHHSTIIVVPHAQGKVYKLRISPFALRFAVVFGALVAVLSVVSLAASGTILRQRAMFHALEKENRQLKKNNQRLAETIDQVQTRLSQFEQRTKTLAIAAGVGDLLNAPSEAAQPGMGSGGPLDRLGAEPGLLIKRQESIDRQLATVEKRLSDQVLLFSHTPSIAPVIGVMTDGFGPRIDPITRRPAFHDGLDISVNIGTPVKAPAEGVVVFAGRDAGYGKMIKISHGFGFTTVFGHLEEFAVREGERVRRGEVIGRVGMTGRTTGPHLHYEVWKDGDRQNPLHYILDAY